MLGGVSKPDTWTQGKTPQLLAIAHRLMVGQAVGSEGLGAPGWSEILAHDLLLEQRRQLWQLLSLARKLSAQFRLCQ